MNNTLIHSFQVLLLLGLMSVGIAGKKATCRQLLCVLVPYSLNQNETSDTVAVLPSVSAVSGSLVIPLVR